MYQETRTTATRLTVAKTNELGFAYEERMHRRTKVIIILANALSGLLASISFFRAARSDEVEGVQSNDADADQSSTLQSDKLVSGVLLSQLARSKLAITSPEDLSRFLTKAPRRSVSPSVDTEAHAVDRALEHVSQLLWYRFFQDDPEVYHSRRVSKGYEPPSADRAANRNFRVTQG